MDTYPTTAHRDGEAGKGRFDLMPVVALIRLAKRLQAGADKYGDRNWENGIPTSRCFSSAFRHLLQAMIGDTSEDHLAAVLFNVSAIMHFQHEIKHGRLDPAVDDVPYKELERGELFDGGQIDVL